MQAREAFEKWASDDGYSDAALERDGFGYKGPELTSDFLIWLAAWNAALNSVGLAGEKP